MHLLVIGMHRSGTSAVGRALAALGVPSAEPGGLIGADPSNPYGHFEVRRLTDLNDRLLAMAGGHWAAPPVLSPGLLDAWRSDRIAEEARAELAATLPGDGWFWKDPRLSVLLPFWAPLVEPFAAVLVHRRPAEVAASLERRNGLAPAYGLALWERYARAAVTALDGVPTHVIDYEQLTTRPGRVLHGLVEHLSEHGWTELEDAEAVAAAIDPEQRHHSCVDHPLSPAQEQLAASLAACAGGRLNVFDLPVAPVEATELAFEVVARLGPRMDELHMVDELRRTLVHERQAAADQQARLRAVLDQERHRFSEEHTRLEAELASEQQKAQANADRLEAELTSQQNRAQAQIDHLDDVRKRYERLAAELTTELDASRALAVALESQVSVSSARADELDRQLHELVDSTAFRAVAVARAGVNRALPVGTRRRAAYGSAVERARHTAAALRRSGITNSLGPPSVILPDPPEAQASIVIPVHGQRDTTHRCLVSLANAPVETRFRTIVVDDCSTDDTPAYLAGCDGIHVVTNTTNAGFLRSTNRGVAASGDVPFVVLLNNDTEVTEGWLDALLAPFGDPAVGAVGAKLVYPDGRLQEVGSIVWRDGTGWNFGRGDDPNRYLYQHVREVDYCSAACLAVRRDLWDELGGFDERYAPAYYEDTDLCFRVRERGYRVVVQPAAVVVHHEGGSHGTEPAGGGKANQERNRPIFVERWRDRLGEHPENDPTLVRRRADRAVGPSVLVVDHHVPTPDRDSGSLRMSKLLSMLVELDHRVRFLPFNGARYSPYGQLLEQQGIEVAGHVDAAAYLDDVGAELDVVVLSRPYVAINMLQLVRERAPQAALVYDMVDAHGLREKRRSSLDGGHIDLSAQALRELELLLVRHADMTLAISDDERDLMGGAAPGATIVTIPNVHDAPESPSTFAERAGLLFVGSWNHPPNRDAISHLIGEVMPVVRARLPDVGLTIVGSDVPARIAEGEAGVEVLGWLPDLGEIFDRVRLSVAPLRYGAGLKGKVGDSLVRGVPVVTTSVGAEGFDAGSAQGLAVADRVDGFVDEIVNLYTDEDRWTRMARAGRAGTLAVYGYGAVRDRLADALTQAMSARR